jgi:hypothetical protein
MVYILILLIFFFIIIYFWDNYSKYYESFIKLDRKNEKDIVQETLTTRKFWII